MSWSATYQVLCGSLDAPSVVLVAQAGYHLDDLLPVRNTLGQLGVDTAIVCPEPRPSVLRRWRSSWWRHRELLSTASAAGLRGSSRVVIDDIVSAATAVVVRNDWGGPCQLVVASVAAHVPTIGWVEGAVDFTDVDSGRARHAYRRVDHVLCLGHYDAEQLAEADVTIVGSERLWRAWHGPETMADGPAIANVNFSYGVLEEARNRWLADIVALRRQGTQPVVLSRHPADRGRRGRRFEDHQPVERLLSRAPRMISRFSTLCYEALALGVELTYHNPHGERVATFTEPCGAFRITRTRSELLEAMARDPASPSAVRRAAEPFLARHLVLDGVAPRDRAAARIADVAR